MQKLHDLGFGIHQIQLANHDTPYRATGYLIQEEKTILIETGAAISIPNILNALQQLKINPEQIDAIAVTHIHLDHAGGAGLLMEACPNAELLVHEKGKKHLVDPEKLIAGAKQVYGDMFDSFFDPVLPIPAERIRVMGDNESYDLGNHRQLRFLNTPGHAFHHLAIHDPLSNGLFSGDIAGIYFKRWYDQYGLLFCLPVAAPPQFQPEIMEQTLSRLSDLKLKRIFFTHFGMSEQAGELIQQARRRTAFFGNACVQHFRNNRSASELYVFIKGNLFDELKKQGVPDDDPDLKILEEDIKMNIKGIVTYIEKRENER
jgi:glyoxylase-like metal-dependent hydrolase (beta-lactamase superfamily II)